MENDSFGVYVGRMHPITLGHQFTLERMIQETNNNCLLVLGSVNSPLSERNLFSFVQRSQLIKTLYPNLALAGLPDFGHIPTRLFALDQLVALKYAGDPKNVIYYGGSEEDLRRFHDHGRQTRLIDRYSGHSPIVSATEVRQALRAGKSIQGLVDPRIENMIYEMFAEQKKLLTKVTVKETMKYSRIKS